MQEELVKKLADFGFTPNQAKVYLSIAQHKSVTITQISKITGLYTQDIYKTLPKLEHMGLIVKSLDTPVMLEAIDVEKALKSLMAIEKEKYEKRILSLKSTLSELATEVTNHQADVDYQVNSSFVPLVTHKQLLHRAEKSFKRLEKSCYIMININLITAIDANLHEHFKLIGKKAKIRIIVQSQSLEQKEIALNSLLKVKDEENDLAAKITYEGKATSYYIFDDNELWVSLQRKTDRGLPCVLCTNDKNMLKLFQESFSSAWSNPKNATIYPLENQKKS